MKIVFDSNVYIAAFATHGICHLLFESGIRDHDVFSSAFILGEVNAKLIEKMKLPAKTVHEIMDYLRAQTIVNRPKIQLSGISRDPDDDNVISLAVEAGAGHIVTGDKDLLDLKRYPSIRIVSPRMFSEILRSQDIYPDE
ncbi:putative toxin-antitoxin system toxin component, PIN family [Candidatus Desulfarcum epimagneticum]|uniref:Putative toxin-antitoxin system toxin component, PIN family n=1 Tax=uncultured Desulfobacteraceae bacterium TaxID=218296 RepID=A0A484HKI0_9BACT|nr:putative toxin-antitoxin system toxin component, PIN family [uncultured Desulfobacteraceae bacterium]